MCAYVCVYVYQHIYLSTSIFRFPMWKGQFKFNKNMQNTYEEQNLTGDVKDMLLS